jgi:hypothetical protein
MAFKCDVVQKNLTTTASPTTDDFTISGFGTPKAAIVIMSHTNSAAPHSAEAQMSIGFIDGTEAPGSCTMWSWIEDTGAGVNTNSGRGHSDRRCGLILGSFPGTEDVSLDWDNPFITDGVRFNVRNTASTNYNVMVILFGGDDIAEVKCDLYDNLGTGTSALNVDCGFSASADLVFLASCYLNVQAANDEVFSNTNPGFSWGCWIRDGGNDTQRNVSFNSQRNQSTSNCSAYLDETYGLHQLNDGSLGWAGLIDQYDGTGSNGGFSVTPQASAASDLFPFLAIRFNTQPQLSLQTVTMPSSAIDWTDTTFGFTPTAMIMGMSDATAAETVLNNTGADTGLAVSAVGPNGDFTIGLAEFRPTHRPQNHKGR